MDDDESHGPVRWTGGPQPRIAYPRHVRALTPGPRAGLLQVVALDLAPIGQCEGIGTLPFHEECALVRRGDVAHELRITKPTVRDDYRRGQLYTAPTKGRYASIQHALHPVQFVAAWRPRACGVGSPNGKVHRDHQLAITNNHDQQHPINAREHPVFLA